MKPSYSGFKAQKNESGFLDVPPVGIYEAVVKKARFVKEDENHFRPMIEMFMEITEGEYKDRYLTLFNDQREKWGDNVTYKGMFRLVFPSEADEMWRKKVFEHNVWAFQDSNAGFEWDWDKDPIEDQLNGKKVCINVRQRLYTYNGKNRETTEIGRLESIKDFKAGRCKPMNPNDRRTNEAKAEESTDGSDFTDVSKAVDVPW